MKRLNNKGFTIVELMIATVVFSVVLLVLTAGIIFIGKTFYKGLISSKTQETARSISDEITQAIQFSSGGAAHTPHASEKTGIICAGSRRYDYILAKQVTDGGGNVFISRKDPACSAAAPLTRAEIEAITLNANDGDRELLGNRMRLVKFELSPTGDLFALRLRIVNAADDNLLTPAADDPNAACDSVVGSEFCATSEISTTIQKRLE